MRLRGQSSIPRGQRPTLNRSSCQLLPPVYQNSATKRLPINAIVRDLRGIADEVGKKL